MGRDATGMFHNNTGKEPCLKLPADRNPQDLWGYMFCTNMLPREFFFTRDGISDMFLPQPQNFTVIRDYCKFNFGVEPRPEWIATEFGGIAGATNIVFSNGLYDAWSSGGVLETVSESV